MPNVNLALLMIGGDFNGLPLLGERLLRLDDGLNHRLALLYLVSIHPFAICEIRHVCQLEAVVTFHPALCACLVVHLVPLVFGVAVHYLLEPTLLVGDRDHVFEDWGQLLDRHPLVLVIRDTAVMAVDVRRGRTRRNIPTHYDSPSHVAGKSRC